MFLYEANIFAFALQCFKVHCSTCFRFYSNRPSRISTVSQWLLYEHTIFLGLSLESLLFFQNLSIPPLLMRLLCRHYFFHFSSLCLYLLYGPCYCYFISTIYPLEENLWLYPWAMITLHPCFIPTLSTSNHSSLLESNCHKSHLFLY